MALSEYDYNKQQYVPRKTGVAPGPKTVATGPDRTMSGNAFQTNAGYQGQPTNVAGDQYNDWRKPYEEMLKGLQAQGGGGGGVPMPTRIDMPEYDPRYTGMREAGYQNVEQLLANPAGYSPEELAMIQGQSLDKIYATVAGARSAATDQASRGGYLGTGIGQQIMANPDKQALTEARGALTGIALQDMQLKREGAYQANAAMQNWMNQMGAEQANLANMKIGLEKEYRDAVRKAQHANASNKSRYNNQLLALQKEIADIGIKQEMYDDQKALTWAQFLGNEGQQQFQNEFNAYQTNPYYTGPRNTYGG
jgi:hypothetical protein